MMKKILLLSSITVSSFFFAQNQTVSLDPSFASQGISVTPYTSEGWSISKIKYLSDGKIMYVGDDNTSAANIFTTIVSRYLSNGQLDTSYGNNGYVRVSDLRDMYNYNFSDTGEFYITGISSSSTSSTTKMYKYTKDGQLDTTFGTNGLLTITNYTSNDLYPLGLVLLPNGKIIFSATTSSNQYGLFRINSNGTIDTTFGQNGFYTSPDRIEVIRLSKDNQLLIVTSHNNNNNTLSIRDFTLKKYDFDLSPSGFSYTFTTDEASWLNFVDDSNKNVYLINNSDSNVSINYLRKILPSGILDTTFGQNGIVTENINTGYIDIMLDNNSKILLAGLKENSSTDINPIIRRYNANGTLDTTFNGTGYKEETSGDLEFFESIDLLPDGSIIGGGETNGKLFILKYNLTDNLSTKENNQDINVKVFPNPATDKVFIKLSNNQEKIQSVKVYSLDGKLLLNEVSDTLNFQSFQKGNYIVEIKTDKNTYSKKIIKK